MKTFDLKETSSGIHGTDRRYFVNGKRVSEQEFRAIKQGARLECFSNAQVNGQWNFYCTATK